MPAQRAKKSGGAGHQIYTQLMNGVSHMLPFVVGGGILIAIAFLIDGICVDMNALDVAERANFGTITPVAAWLKSLGDAAFGFMLPVLAGFIAMAVGDRPALALGFVGGMIASGGKSGFLGALAAGFAAGYIIVLLRKVCDKLPEFLEKIAPVLIYPLAGLLLMGLLMSFVVEPVMGGLNTALNHGLTGMGGTSKVILGLILGGMMAIDMGGPFNKAAYVFGTASIAAGNYDIMAAVMVGGMTPPCAIALASLLFKKKFTKEERIGTDQLYYGTRIYYGRSDSFCSIRSSSCPSGVYRRFGNGRSGIHAFRMYLNGAPWGHLRIPRSGRAVDVHSGIDRRNSGFHLAFGHFKEKYGSIKRDCIIKKNIIK